MFCIVDNEEFSEELGVSASESFEEVKWEKAVSKASFRVVIYDSGRVASVATSPSHIKIEDRETTPEIRMKKYKELIESQIRKLLYVRG